MVPCSKIAGGEAMNMAGIDASVVTQWCAALLDSRLWMLGLCFGLLIHGEALAKEIVWGERVEVDSGEAYRGPWRMNESTFLYVDDPSVAVTDQGAVGVVWADQARQDILLQIYEPDGGERFEEPINVSRSPDTFSWLPRVILTPDEEAQVHVLWQEIVFSGGTHGGEIFYARSTDGGRSFSMPLNLSNTTAGAGKGRYTRDFWQNGSLDLARGENGHLYTAWTEYEGGLRFSRSTDQGRSFSDPVHIAGGEEELPAHAPALAVHGQTVHLVWAVGEKSSADIQYVRSRDGGESFTEPQAVGRSDGPSDAPKLAVDGQGAVHLAYSESPDGPWERYHILYARMRGGEDVFEPAREISVPHPGPFESANFPSLEVDGEGGVYVLWELFPDRHARPHGVGMSYSTDGGETFAPPELVPGSADPDLGISGGQQGLLMRKLGVDRDGGLAVVHSTFNPGVSSHVWLMRGVVTGGQED
jgi:hypothetical protein